MSGVDAVLTPLGDSAVLVQLHSSIGDDAHHRVMAAFHALRVQQPEWCADIVPAYTGLAVHYVIGKLQRDDAAATVEAWIRDVVGRASDAVHAEPRVVEIPVQYGGDCGPDLAAVAENARLSEDDVVALHVAGQYTVHMMGFAPGFAYLAGLDPRLHTPRLDSPRTRVPAGSVGIAGGQTGVYPLATPGGWRLIGRTELSLFDPAAESPTLLRPGDHVRFRAL